MNTYNENLHAGIINSLQAQQLNQKKLGSSLNASMFTLYYAEGATITATENLNIANQTRTKKKAVEAQAVADSNLCTNLVASATQANKYFKQLVSNAAVSAANVQVACNAIVKLASDTSSVFSIINAADYGSSIYTLASEAQGCMATTAYQAEQAGRLAMESSMLTAEVSVPTVLDKAKTANSSMGNLLKIASGEFNNASQAVAADNQTLAAISVKEKAAEGVYEDISADYNAASSAYDLTNKELNLNLQVAILPPAAGTSEEQLQVSFNALQSPFPKDGTPKQPYPVSNYNLIIVKDQNKYTFSVANAENASENHQEQLVIINMPVPAEAAPATGTQASAAATPQPSGTINGNAVTVAQVDEVITCTFKYTDLVDSDGQQLTPGVNYVVFVMAVYSPDYKKKLNVFDDFLSAPSTTFVISTQLPKPANVKENNNIVQYNIAVPKASVRVMFLPFPQDITGMLTDPGYNELEDVVEAQQVVEKKPGSKKGTPAAQQSSPADQSQPATTQLTPEQQAAQQKTLGFIFNIGLAQEVPAGNYIPDSYNGASNILPQVKITPATTDNFGKPLVPGETYMPVVLAMPEIEGDPATTPNMSDLDSSLNFVYKP